MTIVGECFLIFSPEYFVVLFSALQYKNRNIRDSNFACVLCSFEIMSLTLREKHMLTVLWKRVVCVFFGFKREKLKECEKNCEMISFIILTAYKYYYGGIIERFPVWW